MKKSISFLLALFVSVSVFATVTVSPATIPGAYVNHPFSVQLTSSGGTTPMTWAVVGTLPTGLSLTSNRSVIATISGTPSASGSFTYSITATDNAGTVGQTVYTTVITYNAMTTAQVASVWTRGVPSTGYNYDSWYSQRPYTLYSALLSQTGTVTPTATVLFNDLGATPTFAVDPSGIPTFSINIAGSLFDASKTWYSITPPLSATVPYMKVVRTNSTSLTVTSYTTGILSATPFEIRIYK